MSGIKNLYDFGWLCPFEMNLTHLLFSPFFCSSLNDHFFNESNTFPPSLRKKIQEKNEVKKAMWVTQKHMWVLPKHLRMLPKHLWLLPKLLLVIPKLLGCRVLISQNPWGEGKILLKVFDRLKKWSRDTLFKETKILNDEKNYKRHILFRLPEKKSR